MEKIAPGQTEWRPWVIGLQGAVSRTCYGAAKLMRSCD